MMQDVATKELTNEPVGKSVTRIDAYEKATGAAVYVDDMQFGPGLYYGKMVRSPYRML
jgi:CO/xanthine dehydrogenase Mo-binding subunit